VTRHAVRLKAIAELAVSFLMLNLGALHLGTGPARPWPALVGVTQCFVGASLLLPYLHRPSRRLEGHVTVRSGDTLLVGVARPLDRAQAQQLTEALKAKLPGIDILVVDSVDQVHGLRREKPVEEPR
jgi:hypothetical protein